MVEGLLNLFERVFVINLDRRADRWAEFLELVSPDWPFRTPERFRGIDGRQVLCPLSWKQGNGAWGCYRSHLSIIEKCLNENINSVLVMEDDAIPIGDFPAHAHTFFREIPEDWEFVFLGGQHIELHKEIPVEVNKHVFRPFNVNRAHAYAVRGRAMMKAVYLHLQEHRQWNSKHHVDHRFGEMHKELIGGVYVPWTWLFQQRANLSDINGRELEQSCHADTEFIVDERIAQKRIVVLGVPSVATGIVVHFLNLVGVHLAIAADQSANLKGDSRSRGMPGISDATFSSPHFVRKIKVSDVIRRLKMWLVAASFETTGTARHAVGAYHPGLNLLGAELEVAWSNPEYVVVDSELNANDSDVSKIQMLESRSDFLSKFRPSCIHIEEKAVLENPRGALIALGNKLALRFDDTQISNCIEALDDSMNRV